MKETLSYQAINKAEALMNILDHTLKNPLLSHEINNLMRKSKLSADEIKNSFLQYNLDLNESTNIVFSEAGNRFVIYLHNLIEDSWHQEKQFLIKNFLNRQYKKNIIDIGFGVPTAYIKDKIWNNKNTLTLCEFSDAAFNFASYILDEWLLDWKKHISFKKENMDDMNYLGDYDIYIFQDCIEHTIHPTKYLKKQVQESPKNSIFVFVLAIGPLIPMHYIAWETQDIAKNWLTECKLTIDEACIIETNPKIDLFSSTENPFKFYFCACSKVE